MATAAALNAPTVAGFLNAQRPDPAARLRVAREAEHGVEHGPVPSRGAA